MSTTSPARVAANQRNATRSTGPKTPEGKAASRLNAFKHGLAGEGVLLAPGEDSRLVARRAKAFASEFGATGEVGELLAHRAALLSVRMERSADREMTAVAANRAEARDQFDQDRTADLDQWIVKLDDPDAFPAALEVLETTPEGVAHLIATWGELLEKIRSDDDYTSTQAARQGSLWLNPNDDEADALEDGQTSRIDAEISRLRHLADSMTPLSRQIAARRDQAAILGSFDPSPEATLARRYEAAAERGMYRAIRAIAEIRRGQEVDRAPILQNNPPRPQPKVAPSPIPTPLGSFRAEVPAAPTPPIKSLPSPVEPSISDTERRKKRPDLRKLLQNRR